MKFDPLDQLPHLSTIFDGIRIGQSLQHTRFELDMELTPIVGRLSLHYARRNWYTDRSPALSG